MSWGNVAGAGIGLVSGALAGGGGSDGINPIDYIPSYMRGGHQDLTGRIMDLQTPQFFQGNPVAGINPTLGQGLMGMAGWGQGMGGDIMNAQYGTGMLGAGAMGGGLSFMNEYGLQGPQQFSFDQGTFNDVFNSLMPGLQGQFDNAARGIQQNFEWNQLPGLDMMSSNFGLQGSTKLNQAGALGQAMADQQKQEFGQNLYTNALNQATQAGMTGGQQNLGAGQRFGDQMMQGYQRFAGLGMPQLGAAYQAGQGNLQSMMGAGQYLRDFDQQNIQADMDRWNFEQQAPWTALQNQLSMFMGALPGAPSQGAPGMTSWEGALQGAQAGLGLGNALNGMFNQGGGGGGFNNLFGFDQGSNTYGYMQDLGIF